VEFEHAMDLTSKGFEILGVAILLVGSAIAFAQAGRRRIAGERAYGRLRTELGHTILLGLEILVVADIIRTIAVDPTIESAVTLGIIVLVRTFLSFSLEIELDGVVPWRRASARKEGLLDGGPETSS
jgi:uncharacterized membrane protein